MKHYTRDNSGNGYNGTIYGSPTCENTIRGNGLYFNSNSNDDYVQINGLSIDIIPLTIVAWVSPDYRYDWDQGAQWYGSEYPNNVVSGDQAGSGGFGFGLNYISNLSKLEFQVETHPQHNIVELINYDNLKYFFIATVYQADEVLTYLGTSTAPPSFIKAISNLGGLTGNKNYTLIGRHNFEPSWGIKNPFRGIIDEVRIYNRALSEAEVMVLYGATAPGIISDANHNGIPDIYEYQYGFRGSAGYSADPVNTSIGNYVYDHVDLALPGPGMGFEFKRTYNSLNPEAGSLGYGWNYSYNVSVQEFGDNTVVTWGDGQKSVYSKQTDGSYAPVFPGMYDTLTKDSGTGVYSITRKDHSVYGFNTAGSLVYIADKNGNTIALAYDGSGYLSSITDTAGRTITVTNDTSGRITAIADPMGRTAGFAYDASGNLVTATDLRGKATTFTYDSNHRLLTIVDPVGNTVVTHTYNAKNQVATQIDAKGGVTTFSYDNTTNITTLVDPLGHTTQHAYDADYRLIQEQDGLGNSKYYSYDTQSNRTAVTDKTATTLYYDYDATGNVTTKKDALNNVTTITYDAGNNPLTRSDASDNITTFEYDSRGNLIKKTDALGHYTTITYNPQGQTLTITDPEGNTTTNTYDAQGNLKDSTDTLGHKTTYTYDTAGRRLTAKNALNQTTTFAYDNNGNVLSITDPLGHAIVYTYDGNNKKLTETDRNGNTTMYSYDAKSLLTSITDPQGKSIVYGYDGFDRKIFATDRLGHTIQYGYDATGNMISMTDPLGHVTSFAYDAVGNKTGVTNPLGNTTTYVYDSVNRLVTVTDPLGNNSQTTYDTRGRITAKTNAKNQTTQYGYDALGRLLKVTDAAGGMVFYSYDNNGNRLTETDPRGWVTNFVYNELNQLTEKDEPLGGAYQYSYDAAGNRVSTTDPKTNTITYAYDADKRLITRTYPNANTVTFTYDANGNKTGMTDPQGSSTYAYDALNRLTSYTDPTGSTVGYSYDAEGKKLSMTYPGSKTVQYGYDNAGRVSTVTDWLNGITNYTYDAAGNLLQTSNPNNTTASYAYDNAGRLISLQNKKSGGTVVASYVYTLDALGNQVQVVRNEQLTPSYLFDNTTYIYDAENRMKKAGSAKASYDANGNTIKLSGDNQTYNYENRLLSTTAGGGMTYAYDGTGNRLTKTAGGVTTKYVYDIGGSLPDIICDKDAGGAITAYYVYGLGLISKILPDTTASYYHYDSRGSTVAMTDASANIENSYAYNVFGEVIGNSQTVDNSFKYLGKYGITAESNDLYHIRARYYLPGIGRFITKDPRTGRDGDSQSLNRYVYATNNPIRFIDVSGYSKNESSSPLMGNNQSTDTNHNNTLNGNESIGPDTRTDEQRHEDNMMWQGVKMWEDYVIDEINTLFLSNIPCVGDIFSSLLDLDPEAKSKNDKLLRPYLEKIADNSIDSGKGRQYFIFVGEGKWPPIMINTYLSQIKDKLEEWHIPVDVINLLILLPDAVKCLGAG